MGVRRALERRTWANTVGSFLSTNLALARLSNTRMNRLTPATMLARTIARKRSSSRSASCSWTAWKNAPMYSSGYQPSSCGSSNATRISFGRVASRLANAASPWASGKCWRTVSMAIPLIRWIEESSRPDSPGSGIASGIWGVEPTRIHHTREPPIVPVAQNRSTTTRGPPSSSRRPPSSSSERSSPNPARAGRGRSVGSAACSPFSSASSTRVSASASSSTP